MLWKLPTIVLRSELNFVACLQKLREEVDTDRITASFNFSRKARSKPVLGFVSGREFRIRKRWAIPENRVVSYFWGQLNEDGSGTRIEGYYGVPAIMRKLGLLSIVLPGVLGSVVFVRILIAFIQGHAIRSDAIFACLVFVVFVVFFSCLGPGWSVLARKQEAFLIEFLERVLVARREKSQQ
jgi:hypothetical protein